MPFKSSNAVVNLNPAKSPKQSKQIENTEVHNNQDLTNFLNEMYPNQRQAQVDSNADCQTELKRIAPGSVPKKE